MKKRNMNKKGFTLIELLAVIVILGVIMAIAIPSMTGYIENSKKDTMLDTAQQYIDGAKTLLISENALPSAGEAVVVKVDDIELDKGGVSPYDNKKYNFEDGLSYVLVYNNAANDAETNSESYLYYAALTDKSNHCMEPINEDALIQAKSKKKRGLIKNGANACNITALNASGTGSINVTDVIGTAPAALKGRADISYTLYE